MPRDKAHVYSMIRCLPNGLRPTTAVGLREDTITDRGIGKRSSRSVGGIGPAPLRSAFTSVFERSSFGRWQPARHSPAGGRPWPDQPTAPRSPPGGQCQSWAIWLLAAASPMASRAGSARNSASTAGSRRRGPRGHPAARQSRLKAAVGRVAPSSGAPGTPCSRRFPAGLAGAACCAWDADKPSRKPVCCRRASGSSGLGERPVRPDCRGQDGATPSRAHNTYAQALTPPLQTGRAGRRGRGRPRCRGGGNPPTPPGRGRPCRGSRH